MKRLVALSLLVCACGRVERFETGDDLLATCDPQHYADGPACLPRFDTCAADDVPELGGGCTKIGPTCGPGFVSDGGGCRAVLPSTPCDDMSFALPGDTTCQPVEACGEEKWKPGDLYVDGSYAGPSDGSSAKPFRTIGEAIAAVKDDGTTISITDGTYTEDLTIGRRMNLVGRCPARVSVVGTKTAIDAVATKLSLSGFSVVSRGIGVHAEAAALAVSSVVIRDADEALRMRGGPVTLDRVSIVRAAREGIVGNGWLTVKHGSFRDVNHAIRLASGGTGATIEDLVVDHTNGSAIEVAGALDMKRSSVREVGDGSGVAVVVDGMVDSYGLRLSSVVVERTKGAGVVAKGPARLGAAVEITDTTVRDAGRFGISIVHTYSPEYPHESAPKIASTLVDHTKGGGVEVAGTDADIERTIVRNMAPSPSSGCAVCSQFEEPTTEHPKLFLSHVVLHDNALGGIALRRVDLAAADVRVEGSGHVGIDGTLSTATLERTIVRDTGGIGILASGAPERHTIFQLTDGVVERNATAGIALSGLHIWVTQSIVRDTRGGAGIYVTEPEAAAIDTALHLRSTLVERNEVAGVLVARGDAFVSESVLRANVGDGFASVSDWSPGGALRVATSTFERTLFADNTRAGVALFGAASTLRDTRLRCNGFDVDGEDHLGPASFDDAGETFCACHDVGYACGSGSAGLSLPPRPSL